MKPLKQWLAVKRHSDVESSYLWVPEPSHTQARIGEVLATGTGKVLKASVRPFSVSASERILYSSRVDTYQLGDEAIDVIEEDSIIGVMMPSPKGAIN